VNKEPAKNLHGHSHRTGANFWPGRTCARVTSAARRKGEQQVGRKMHDEKRQTKRGGSRERESEYRRRERKGKEVVVSDCKRRLRPRCTHFVLASQQTKAKVDRRKSGKKKKN